MRLRKRPLVSKGLIVGAAVLLAHAAQASGCPESVRSGQGIELISKSGERYVISRMPSDVIAWISFKDDKVRFSSGNSIGLYQDFIQTDTTGFIQTTYMTTRPANQIPNPSVAYTIKQEDTKGQSRTEAYLDEAIGRESIKIGDCEYETVVIKRTIKNFVNTSIRTVTMNYSEKLSATIRSKTMVDGSLLSEHIFQSVKAIATMPSEQTGMCVDQGYTNQIVQALNEIKGIKKSDYEIVELTDGRTEHQLISKPSRVVCKYNALTSDGEKHAIRVTVRPSSTGDDIIEFKVIE